MNIPKFLTAGGMILSVAAVAGALFSNAGAASAAYLVLSDYFRLPGQALTVMGRQFVAHEPVDVRVGTSTMQVTANSSGEFSAGAFTTPAPVNTTVTVDAHGSSSHVATSLRVGGYWPVVEPSTYFLVPGQSLIVRGRGFAPNEMVTMSGNIGTTTQTFTIQANGSGNFEFGPLGVGYTTGDRTSTFTGSVSNNPYHSTIHVAKMNPWVTLSSYYLTGGSSVSVTARGLGANETAHLYVAGTQVATAMTNSQGEVSFNTTVPGSGSGTVEFRVHGALTNANASATLTRAH